jgi:hypothetical protein
MDLAPHGIGPRRRRGRRQLRSVEAIRARRQQIADDVVDGKLTTAQGAVADQALGGVLACVKIISEKELLKRLEAVEAATGTRKRGSDA